MILHGYGAIALYILQSLYVALPNSLTMNSGRLIVTSIQNTVPESSFCVCVESKTSASTTTKALTVVMFETAQATAVDAERIHQNIGHYPLGNDNVDHGIG